MPAPLTIVLSVEVSDGSFASSVRVPVNVSPEGKKRAVDAWFQSVLFAIQLGAPVDMKMTLDTGK